MVKSVNQELSFNDLDLMIAEMDQREELSCSGAACGANACALGVCAGNACIYAGLCVAGCI